MPQGYHLTRRAFLLTTADAALGLGFYRSRWTAPFSPELNSKEILLAKPFARPLTVAHISDLHLFGRMPLAYFEHCCSLTAATKPDLICITGDFISWELAEPAVFSALLRTLSTAAPTFACLGNHDGGSWAAAIGGADSPAAVIRALADAQIHCLINEAREVTIAGQPLVVGATADLWTAPIRFSREGKKLLESDAPVVLLAHNPDTKDVVASLGWDVLLSGHTHGGEIAYPGMRSEVIRDQRFISGLIPWQRRWVHVSRGLGTTKGMRVNCPPEITVLTLRGSAA